MADDPGQHPGVNVADARNAILFQQIVDAVFSAPVARHTLMTAHNEAVNEWAHGFKIVTRNAIVPDQRIGHRHDLSAVGRV
ncbi:hypothetical protein D3C73_1537590 [compost metagenome]